MEISEIIYPIWLELARMLGIPEENLHHICSVINKLPMEMLLKCKITDGKNATANMLVEHLNAFGRRQEPEYVTNNNEVFKEKLLNDDYNIRDEIVNILQRFKWINGPVGTADPNQEIPYEHLFITVDKREKMSEEQIKEEIDNEFEWEASRFIELRSSASKPLKLKYYGHVRLSNTSQDISVNICFKCELTMFCRKDENYFALTYAHDICKGQWIPLECNMAYHKDLPEFIRTDNFKSAQKFARRAIATSNIESDDESINDKPRKRPRLKRSMEEFPDYSDIENDDDSDETVIQHRAPQLPPAPRYASFSMNNKHLLESSESNMITAVIEILSTNSRNLPVYSELISFEEKGISAIIILVQVDKFLTETCI
ncbi:uncharacterized protein LOC124451895 [Xenia sp. Carnegie-2017]|uniref:uncharacterized protein LOC124451895 n=1 Tax=Xenia sp. Carnegie-2017 TaxID=2897299 RepID=UPI001F046F9E|nr:uncharacterized protein LOC124451895 [Xenia sp. Carnegie-2017]